MRRLTIAALAALLTTLACAAQTAPSPQGSQASTQTKPSAAKSRIVVPAGTTVSLALSSPILAKTAKAGDSVYAETAFPVAVKNQMAIPPGTYVQGQIDALSRPGWLSPHAQFQIHFTKIIYENGYTVVLPSSNNVTSGLPAGQQAAFATPAPPDDVIAAVANAYVDVSSSSDVLLDNGTQIEMVLQLPLRLSAASVADAVRRSGSAPLPQFKSATLCRAIPGTPGTPDTVIPGTPGIPGTPPTVIPGGPGMPDTVIPGTPATPGTSGSVIHGDPGTPGVSCPGPPIVTSNPKALNYKEPFQLNASVQVSGTQLSAGSYQVSWKGLAASTQVEILQNGNVVATVPARVVLLNRKSDADAPSMHTNSDGSVSLRSLRFAGQSFALYFDQGAA
jgi:hypothetical protein